MRNYHLPLLAATLLMLLTACHSNEANYKAAYDKARAKQSETIGEEDRLRIEAERKRHIEVVGGDSVRIVPIFTNVTDDSASVAHRYNVVVGQFKQVFSARNYRDRLRDDKAPEAFLLYSAGRDPRYYVIALTSDDKAVAADFCATAAQRLGIKVLEPEPWILMRP